MFEEMGAHHGGKTIARKAVVIYLRKHIDELARTHCKQIADPLSVGAQTHGEVAQPGTQESVHFPATWSTTPETAEKSVS
jgi:hypothetical protein